jgi:hypothetical protein
MYNNARITRENDAGCIVMFKVTKLTRDLWARLHGKSKACVYANDLENLGVTLMPSAVIGIKPHYEKTKIKRESSNKSKITTQQRA